MTHQPHPNVTHQVVQLLSEQGFEGMAEAMVRLLNECMKIERQQALGVGPYQRGEARRGQANGFKPKTMKTRIGPLQLAVPQVRGAEFYPRVLERGTRSEKALRLALAEMYVQGVSTSKVTKITEELCGCEVSSSDVSRATALLDEELTKWRNRPLSAVKYLILDARYEKVRQAGCVRSCAVLTAIGVDAEGRRSILGVSVSLSEGEVHWREFFKSLLQRGLHGLELIVSDAHAGLKEARQARGLSQYALGALVAASQDDVYRYEAGKISPGLERLVALAKSLNVTADWLTGLSDRGGPRRRKLAAK